MRNESFRTFLTKVKSALKLPFNKTKDFPDTGERVEVFHVIYGSIDIYLPFSRFERKHSGHSTWAYVSQIHLIHLSHQFCR